MIFGFDIYHQPVDQTISQIKGFGIDLSAIHEEKWQGRTAFVVGAVRGDLGTPQFWVDKKNLYFVRLIQLGGREKKVVQETQFNKYFKVNAGGWVAPEVLFFADGKPTTTEIYTDVRTDIDLDTELWNPEKWMLVDRNYYKKKQ
jgi:hypothetical protein